MVASKGLVASFIACTLCVTAWVSHDGVSAQIPDKFTNLKVLPKDISKRELMENMKSFAIGLGVRCQYCHVGEDGMPLSEFDFVSDEKETKIRARVMIQMRDEINERLLPELGALRSHSIEVACVTCHRGQPVPRMLEDVLTTVIEKEGVEPAIEKYREYRELYYGGFSYDFGEMTLIKVASSLAGTDPASAITFLNLNLEFHPESWTTLVQLGDVHLSKGEKETALSLFKKAFASQPHPMLKHKIDSLSEDN